MTVLFVLAVKDRALDAFAAPMFVPAIAVASRSFTDECQRKESPLNQHPEDYDLYHIGHYDDATARLESIDPRCVMRAQDVVRRE